MDELFTEDEIEELSSIKIEDLDDLDLESLRNQSYTSNLKKGILFYKCYNILFENLELFEKDKREKITERFKDLNISEISRSFLIVINELYGMNYEVRKIEDFVIENSKDIKDLITLFFQIFFGDRI